MKHILLFTLLCFSLFATAQCPNCDPDLTCTSTDGFPAICPFEAPVGYTGEYYEHTLTFYIPTEVDDPQSGITATLLSVEFTSVTGMPFGLTFTINDADSTYHPVDGENYGCATICGIPLLPGVYNVNITVSILASAFGFEITQIETFPYTLIIEPGSGGTSSFTFDNPAGCGAVQVQYEAIIEGDAASLTTWDWDFGNGQTSDQKIPDVITYDAVGEYEATLTTTISNFIIDTVSISNLSDAGENDVDDFFSPPADPYFVITDGSGSEVYSSSEASNTTNTSWTDINLLVSNPPYSIQFFDADDLSADDDLGTITVEIIEGNALFDAGNGTTGSIDISLVVQTTVTDTATVTVFPMPNADFTVNGTTLTFEDPSLVTFVWYINGIPQDNMTNTMTLEQGGQYYCEVTNEFGCMATSSTYLYCPEITVQYDALANEVYVDPIYQTYQWFYNGIELPGANQSYIAGAMAGNYAVEITTSYGCTTTSAVYTVTVGIEEAQASFRIYPNPTEQVLNIQCPTCGSNTRYEIHDIAGRLVMNGSLNQSISVADLQAGLYVITMGNLHQTFRKQ